MGHPRNAPVGEYLPFRVNATASSPVAVGALVNTTSATTITAGTGVVVTPASMANIAVGMQLNVANGSGTAETVQVLSVNQTAGTFTANFANNHSGAYTIISLKGSYLGSIVINQIGSGVSITLYNGHPSLLPAAGTPFAVITPAVGVPYDYHCLCNRGLFYTLTGTPGDYTITYLDAIA
jgi:hypothetical protein